MEARGMQHCILSGARCGRNPFHIVETFLDAGDAVNASENVTPAWSHGFGGGGGGAGTGGSGLGACAVKGNERNRWVRR